MLKSVLQRLAALKKLQVGDNDPYIYKSSGPVEVVMIVVIDLAPAVLEEIVAVIKAKFGKTRKIVCVTDNADFNILRQHGLAFEYLPPLAQQRLHAADMPWRGYLSERWSLIKAKWRPALVLSYGMNIDTFLAVAPTIPPADPVS